ncbi:MAG: hypothetical protein AABX77_02670 [Nanoarchaeota archaeon]
MKTLKENKNGLLKRTELVLELESEKNPRFDEVRKKLAERFSKPEENIDVYNIRGSFGKNTFIIKANIYESKEDFENMKKLEITRKKRKEAKKSQEKTEEKSE